MADTAEKTVDHAERKETAAMTNKLKSKKTDTGQTQGEFASD